ncbi:MAG: TonB family protein [Terriglobales bacterium]
MNAAVAQELWKGQTIDGKFPLLEWLGGSTHSAVFRTQLPGSSTQPAAIKLIRADRPDAAQQIACWRELVTLSHPNLLRVFHAGHCQMSGVPWLYVAMEYAEENVDQVLPVRPLSMTEVGDLLPPVLDALAFLHSKNFVHARIKPSNICAVKNQLKLSADSIHPVTQAFKPAFLTAYDAPESEAGSLSPAADMWSLGMTVVAAFDQRPLTWSRSNTLDPVVPKSIPAPYGQIARECLRMNPAERCSITRIKDLVRQEAPKAAVIAPKQPKRKTSFAPLLVVLVLVAIFIVLKFRHASESQPAPAAPVIGTEQQLTQQKPIAPAPPPSISDQKPTAYASRTGAIAKSPAKSAARPPVPVVETTPSAQGIAKQVLPQVPFSARQTIHGKVRVKVQVAVDPSGNVSSANLVVPGPSRYFARLALESSQQWKFQPAGVDGQPAASHWLLEYRFGRSATEVTPIAVR